MKKGDWVVFKGKFPTPRDGEEAEVKEVVSLGDSVGVGIQFLKDDFPMGAHPDEIDLVVEW